KPRFEAQRRSLIAEHEPREAQHDARQQEEHHGGHIPGRPLTHLGLDAQTLGPPQRVHLLEQVELRALPLQLLHALAQQHPVLPLPLQQPLQHALRVGLVADGPHDGHGAEEGAQAGDPRPAARGRGGRGGRRVEEEEDEGVEDEEGAVEGGDLAADGVDTGLPEGDAAGDELLLLDPLLEQELVGDALGDLVERVPVLVAATANDTAGHLLEFFEVLERGWRGNRKEE
ncbi:unnamed protein product, partial [Musa hybrid cultivar]